MTAAFPWSLAGTAERDFLARVRPLVSDFPVLPRGIWTSEMFAFCVWATKYAVGVVLESGVYKGQSTQIMDRFFDPAVKIVSIDHKWQPGVTGLCRDRWWGVVAGDAADMIPHALASPGLPMSATFRDKPVALLIDGPKGEPAIRLACDMLARHPNVAFAAIHDLYRPIPPRENSARTMLDGLPNTWTSDDPAFVERFRYLDRENYAKWLDETGHGKMPYRYLGRTESFEMASYGPTLGVITR